ncbi:MAG: phospholipase D-like domain-containing protein [Candidatus Helarchaeota archaeon]
MLESKVLEYTKEFKRDLVPTFWKRENKESIFIPKLFLIPHINPNNNLFHKTIIDVIHRAKRMICICSFLISDEDIKTAIEQAAQRGVNTYILTNMEKLPESYDGDEESDKTFARQLKFLKDLYLSALFRSAEFFHAKFLLIDPSQLLTSTPLLPELKIDLRIMNLGCNYQNQILHHFSSYFVMHFGIIRTTKCAARKNLLPASRPI